MTTQFDALLADLDVLAKAQSCDDDKKGDKKIAAAAKDGEDISDVDESGEDRDGDDDADGEDEKFGKSFTVKLEDGTDVEAIDGTALVKALHGEVETLKVGLGESKTYGDELAKALEVTVGVLKGQAAAIAEQDKLIKSLRADMAKLGGQGSGRRAVVNVHEKMATGAPAQGPAKLDTEQLVMKALSLQAEGKIGALEVARVRSHAMRGQVPEDLAHFFVA